MSNPFIDREEWGARPPRNTQVRPTYPATHIVVHHGGVKGIAPDELLDADGDGAPDKEEGIWSGYQDFHLDVKKWFDIAYSFGFGRTGARYEGRGWRLQPGATGSPHDRFSVAFCAIGNFEKQKPTDDMLEGMVKQAVNGIRKGHLVTPDRLVWIGHRDKPFGTSCPGKNLYAEIPNLIKSTKRAWRQLNAPKPEPLPPIITPPPVVLTKDQQQDARLGALELAVFGGGRTD